MPTLLQIEANMLHSVVDTPAVEEVDTPVGVDRGSSRRDQAAVHQDAVAVDGAWLDGHEVARKQCCLAADHRVAYKLHSRHQGASQMAAVLEVDAACAWRPRRRKHRLMSSLLLTCLSRCHHQSLP